jgi:hypothetical protein
VHRGDAAARGHAETGAHRLEVLVVADLDVQVAEAPRGLLAQHARRLAGRVALDDASVRLQITVRAREGGRVQPKRVGVAGEQRDGHVERHLVEHPPRRLGGRRPVAGPPAAAAEPAAGADRAEAVADARERLVE